MEAGMSKKQQHFSGGDYLALSAEECLRPDNPYGNQFKSMVWSVFMDDIPSVASAVANRPLRDYEMAPVAVVVDAAQKACDRGDAEGLKEVLLVGLSLLAKWPDFLNITSEGGHPYYNMEAK
jgi:hypothetical protein